MKRGIKTLLAVALAVVAFGGAARAQFFYWNNLAGVPGGGGSEDGAPGTARFNYPNGVAMDGAGNVYVADAANNTIRKITSAGVTSTLAGSPGVAGSSDGTGSAALFNYPTGVAADGSGNVYVADSGNYTIRKVTSSGAVTTIAGSPGQSGSADGSGAGASFGCFTGLAIDGGGNNLYIADTLNQTIRQVTVGGAVTTIAGTTGQGGFYDGVGGAAQFYNPIGIGIDGSGNLYVADTYNHTIRKLTHSSGSWTTSTLAGHPTLYGHLDGTGGAAQFYFPQGISVDGNGNVFVTDTGNDTVRQVSPAGVVVTLAGSPGLTGTTNGSGTTARFNDPTGLVVNGAGNTIYVADTANQIIRKVSYGVASNFAGSSPQIGSTNATGVAASFNGPSAVALDGSGNLYVTDAFNSLVRKITPSGVVTALAGTAVSPGTADGTGTAGHFQYPGGLASDSSGNLYVADNYSDTIREVTPAGVVTTIAGSSSYPGNADGTGTAATFNNPNGIAIDSTGTNLYVADTYNNTIRKVTTAGVVTTIAGTANVAGSTDGIGTAALFNNPTGVALDGSGNLYVADSGNGTIRKLTVSGTTWTSTTLAGTAGVTGSSDGTGGAAQFGSPTSIAVDSSGNLYVSDSGNDTIRMITPAGVVTTIGGTTGVAGGIDGVGTAGQFSNPGGLAVNAAGLYVADTGNNRITVGGTVGTQAATPIAATTATVNGQADPNGLATTAYFQYGTTTAYTGGTTTSQNIGSGTSFEAVSANLTGLTANTTYHYREVITNLAGTFYGTDQTFTTLPSVVPTISTGSLASGTQGIPYSATVAANNNTMSFGATNLQAGLSINPITGIISGTPTVASANSVTLSATNVVGTGTKVLTLTISSLPLPVITSATTASGVAGSNFNYSFTASNFPTNLNVGPLPTGLGYNSTSSLISGVVSVPGTYNITLSATNNTGTTTTTLTVTIQPPYTWSNYAGVPQVSGSSDGSGQGIGLINNPQACVTDSNGNVFVVDSGGYTIRKITPAGVMTTFAGTAGQVGSADGTGSAAQFYFPNAIAIDGSNNLYVADTDNDTIRKITPTGVVTTLAGLAGISGSTDGTGSAARFYGPEGIAIDGSNNIYVSDTDNFTIRKITPTGVVTTVAGLAGTSGSTDGTSSAARFYYAGGLTVDPSSGNIFVADIYNYTIRKVTPAGVVTTFAGTAGSYGSTNGTGNAALFEEPKGVAADGSGNIYVADSGSSTIRKITSAAVVTTFAGTAGTYGSSDGTGTAAQFDYPQGLCFDFSGSGNLYVADSSNDTIRKVTTTGVVTAVVTTLMGTPEVRGSSDGVKGTVPEFNSPQRIAVDSNDNIYVADTGNDTIREVTPAGFFSTIAGTAGATGTTDGTGSAIRFNAPTDLAFDHNGNLFVADSGNHTIRKLTFATGTGWTSTTFAGTAGTAGSTNATGIAASFHTPTGLAIDTGNNIYVADTGNQLIRKITTPAGAVTTLAGSVGSAGSTNATGTAAKFSTPTDVAVDANGNVYVADEANYLIREITPAGVVTTVAGTAATSGSSDGIGAAARFGNPSGIAVDANGFLYVADQNNSTIRKILPSGTNWMVTTIGGTSGYVGYAGGVGAAAQFWGVQGVTVDAGGNVFVGDTINDRIAIGASILPPSITSLLTANGTQNSPFTYGITATNMPTPFSSYGATGLPAGLSVNAITGAVTGTPTGSGSFSPSISATNLAGTANANLALTIASSQVTYASWASQQGLTGANALPTAILSHDGLTNLFKYAQGLNPFVTYNPGDPRLPVVQTQNISGTLYLALTFTGTATDVTYKVQATSDLNGAWSTIQSFSSGGTAPGTVTVQDNQAVGASPKRFMRLLMTTP